LIPEGVDFRMDSATLLFLLLVIAVTTFLRGFIRRRCWGTISPR
jgi:uncharacterized membrane protein